MAAVLRRATPTNVPTEQGFHRGRGARGVGGRVLVAVRLLVFDAVGITEPDVAAELGLSLNAVILAKSRVLKRLREELQGLTN